MAHFSILRSLGAFAVQVLILTSANASVVHGQCEDLCSDILKFGIFDESYLDSEHVDYRYFQYALRQNKRSADRFQISQMLSYLSPLESFSNEWAATAQSQRLEVVESGRLEERFTRDSLLHFVRSANETLVNAWLSCINLSAGRPALTAKVSLDGQSFSLAADSGVRDLPLSLFGRASWKRQLSIVPQDAVLNCSRGFRNRQTRDSITCQRNPARSDEQIEITLLTEFGAQQPIAVLPTRSDIEIIEPPVITVPVPLSRDLELGSHTFQHLIYRPAVSVSGVPYANALFLTSQDQTASMVTYRIPPGAATFRTRVISYQATCDGSHGGQINGWRVVFSVPGLSETRIVESYWNNSSDQEVVIPLTNLQSTSDRTLSIAVDPAGYRYCDHSALGSPHFEPETPSTSAYEAPVAAVLSAPVNAKDLSLPRGQEHPNRTTSGATLEGNDQGCCRVEKYPIKTSWECYDNWTRANCYAAGSDLLLPVAFFKDMACAGVPDCR